MNIPIIYATFTLPYYNNNAKLLKMSEVTKENLQKERKMTLKGYYSQLLDASHPKTDFMNEIAIEAGVSVATVRNWGIYGMRPQRRIYAEILSRKTGIPVENLWED